MGDLRALIQQYESKSPLKELSTDECIALTDLLILAVMIDGEITSEELQAVTDQSEKLPFERPEDYEELMAEHAFKVKAEIEALLGDEKALQSFIEARTARIKGEEKREESLKMIAVVAYSDGVDAAEEDLCHKVGAAFGFSEDQIEAKLVLGSLDSF